LTVDEIRLKFSSLFNPEPYEGLGFNFSFAELLPAAKIQFLIGDISYLFSSDIFRLDSQKRRARGPRQPQHCINRIHRLGTLIANKEQNYHILTRVLCFEIVKCLVME
jgi:hypothetical protein